MTKHIVIVGAGFTGVLAAKLLSKHYKNNSNADITLIDRHSYFTYLTRIHEVATDRVPAESVQYDLHQLFNKNPNVHLVTDFVNKIDTDNKKVIGEHGQYDYDSILISLGGEPNDFGTPGVKENGFTLWSLEDALKLKTHIEDTIAAGAIERDPEIRKRELTLVICGSGFTGAETIGELIDYRKTLARENKIDPSEIRIMLVEAAPTIINMLSRPNAKKAEDFLTKNGIEIKTGAMITKVDEHQVEIKDSDPISTDTLVWTAGVKASSIADSFGIDAGRGGRLIVNKYLQAKGYEDQSFYIAGDDANVTQEGAQRAVPQTAQEGESEAKFVSHNIEADIDGNKNYKEFKDENKGFVVSFGSHYGIAQILKNTSLHGWIATIAKHGSNMVYFWNIKSGRSIWRYILDEFFRPNDKRTVFGDNTAKNSAALWSVLFRFLLGAAFFFDGMANMHGSGSTLITGVGGFAAACELSLGCFMFFGLFTSIASFLMIILLLFCPITWPMTWILIGGSLALMNGAGRSFGLDHWVIPAVFRSWGKSRYGTPKSLYNDKPKD